MWRYPRRDAKGARHCARRARVLRAEHTTPNCWMGSRPLLARKSLRQSVTAPLANHRTPEQDEEFQNIRIQWHLPILIAVYQPVMVCMVEVG